MLPDDVLVEVFKLVYEFWPTNEHKQRFEIQVCQRWRSLIIDTPLLWTTVYVPNASLLTGPSYYNAHSLERSKGALLDLFILDNSDELHLNQEDSLKTYRVLVEQHSRIGRLSILAVSEIAVACVLANWKSEDTPYLTTLRVNAAYGKSTPTTLGYVKHWFKKMGLKSAPAWPGLPNLRSLLLNKFDVRRFPASANLRELELVAFYLTVEGLQGVLEQFPALETLKIPELKLPTCSRVQAEIPDGTVICAPSLRKLAIGSFYRHSPKCICGLVYLAAPNLEHLELKCRPSLLTQHHFSVLLHPDNTQNLSKIRLAFKTAVLSDDAAEFLRGLPGQERIDLEASWISSTQRWQRDIEVLLEATTGMRSLTIDFDFSWAHWKNSNAAELIETVRHVKKCSPTFVRGLTHAGDKLSYQAADDALLGSGIELLRSPVPDWLVERWMISETPRPYFESDESD